MFCNQCGKEIREEIKFCPYCGEKINYKIVNVDDNKEIKKEQSNNKRSNSWVLLEKVASVIAIIIGFILGKLLGLVIFLFLFAYLIGSWFPNWYLKRSKVNYKFIKFIVWSNVLTWLLPPLGILTSISTFKFSNLIKEENKKYKNLALIGIILSIINAILGYLISL